MNLSKDLKTIDVYSIASGAMISSGIFILPSLAYLEGGPSIIISYFLGGLFALIGILGVIELTTAMPKAGGDYFFITRALGPLIGTVSGILSWIAISLKTAFAIYGIGAFIADIFFQSFDLRLIHIISIIVTIFFVILNLKGVDIASKFETTIVMFLIFIMITYIVKGLFSIDLDNYTPFIHHYSEVIPLKSREGIFAIFTTTAFIFVSFGGLLKVATISEEVKKPKKSVPAGILLSITSITIIYTLMIFVTVGNIDAESLINSSTPISDTARNFLGTFGFVLVSIGAMLAFISTANAGIMSASRYPLALSRDRLIPRRFSSVAKKQQTPTLAIIVTGIIICISMALSIENLAKYASTVILMTYILTNISIIIIRESNVIHYKPTFKVPLYPLPQLVSIVIFSFFIYKLGYKSIELAGIIILISLIVYFIYGRKRSVKESALLHLILRITKNINLEHTLEGELRDIIKERDNIKTDAFDNIIKEALILDIDKRVSLDELFKLEAESISENLGVPEDTLIKLFHEREKESTTAVTDFTAIPHIILDKKNLFYMVVVRCKEGIEFCEERKNIKAIFLFISSKNLIKTHLKTLASIASLTREEDFEKRWLEAKNENYIRDMILLSERKRYD